MGGQRGIKRECVGWSSSFGAEGEEGKVADELGRLGRGVGVEDTVVGLHWGLV